jgi:glycosyltransferase involved in cell wall biosynthesis
MKRFQAENRDKFRRKWAAALTGQPPFDPRQLFLARDRNRGPLVLVLDHYVPTPDRDAGSVFMDRFLAELTHQGCRVVFWPENQFASPGYTERLQQRGIEVVYGAVSLDDYLRKLGRKVDAAIAYRSRVAAKFLPIVRAHSHALGYILCDLESLRESRRIELDGEDGGDFEALRQRETGTMALADCIGVHSPVERAILQSLAPQRRVFDLPLPGPSMRAGSSSFDDRRDLIFVGSTHPPNVDALSHFVKEVWPAVRGQLGPLALQVAGDVCRSVPHLARQPGVELLGHVSDLSEVLARARVFVSPLRYGAGIKGKVLAAMTAGVPLVTTPVGAEGIGLVHGRSALIAETDADFARHVVRLYRDRSQWEAVRQDAMAVFADQHSAGRFREAVTAFVNALLRPGDLVLVDARVEDTSLAGDPME